MKYIIVNVDNGDVNRVDESYKMSNNFTASELACKDGSDTILYSARLVRLIQAIRDAVGPVTISSAYRTPSHNAKVGGVSNSKHQYGIAVDLKCPGNMTVAEFGKVVEDVAGVVCGIGVYDKERFVHLDIRNYKARW